jgi:capsular exopolysaccharide synthesis family protein
VSRTYEALNRAEQETGAFRMPLLPGDDGRAEPAALGYQQLGVWVANLATRAGGLRALLVVSCRAATGTTTVAAALAATLAEETRRRVLITEANFRTPSLDVLFNLRGPAGLGEVVAHGHPAEQRIQPTHRRNLFALLAGHGTLSPAALFESVAMHQLLADLRRRFDFIVFDGPPVLEFPDSYALAPQVDGIVLVVAAERTAVREAQLAKRKLEFAGGRVIGVVLNRQRDYTPPVVRWLSALRSPA